jgi:hypothetical protein
MRKRRVEGFSPRILAAPLGPLMRQSTVFSTERI